MTKQIEFGTSVHRPLYALESVNVTLRAAV